MSIQDLNFLKHNSEKKNTKYFCEIKTQSGTIKFNNSLYNVLDTEVKTTDDHLIYNIFTIHIVKVDVIDVTKECILHIFADNIKMDSIFLSKNGIVYGTNGIEYENIIHPISKLSEMKYEIISNDGSEVIVNLNITVIVRNYHSKIEFNNNYNDLNPTYDPNILPLESESESDEED